jgi:hypothetical protein
MATSLSREDMGLDEEDEEDDRSLSLENEACFVGLMGAAEMGSSRAGSKGAWRRCVLRSAKWHSSEQ